MKKVLIAIFIFSLISTTVIIFGKKANTNRPYVFPEKPIAVQPIPPSVKEITLDNAIESIIQDTLKTDLEHLASDALEGRMSGKKGNVLAAEYIKKKYESFGLQTMYDRFQIRRLNPGPSHEMGDDFTQNVYAWIEGNDPSLKDEIVVIGAHLDHIGYGPSMSRGGKGIHPGADDNASGTVALLEIAEAFSLLKGKIKRTVVFQSYSAEEMGLIGSKFYCNHPKFPQSNPSMDKHVAMINMDMIGYLGKGRFATPFNDGESSIDLNEHITSLHEKYSFAQTVTSRGTGGSDHACFYNKHVPVAFLHTGLHDHYHTPNDTADKINYEGLEKVARYGFELSWKIVQSDSKPKFNMAKFTPMDYTHDHGHLDMEFKDEKLLD